MAYGLGGDDTLIGNAGYDRLEGGNGFNIYRGGAGDDYLIQSPTNFALNPSDGGRAEYGSATGPIIVNLGTGGATLGTVSGNASVGTDTLDRVEWVVGTNFNDTFTVGNTFVAGDGSTFAEITGGGGNDTITGNGSTRIAYQNAAAGVTVDLLAQTGQSTGANDAANVGIDTFTGVNAIRGSGFDDTLYGSNSTTTVESFRGQAGNDYIDGRGGQDRADYRNSTSGISVTMGGVGIGTGTVLDGFGGTDTLLNIERIRGSEFADTITMDDGSNRVEGQAGDDTIFGLDGNDTLLGGDGNDTWSAPIECSRWNVS